LIHDPTNEQQQAVQVPHGRLVGSFATPHLLVFQHLKPTMLAPRCTASTRLESASMGDANRYAGG
jgi:hypothetical protein